MVLSIGWWEMKVLRPKIIGAYVTNMGSSGIEWSCLLYEHCKTTENLMRHFLSMLVFGLAICVTSQANAQFTFPDPGDLNDDGVVDGADIPPFISLLQSGTYSIVADLNQDFAVNFLDIAPFSDLLSFEVGDVNTDGAINFLDISPFVAVLNGDYHPLADINRDYAVNAADISAFIALLQSQ